MILEKVEPDLILRTFQEQKITHIFLPPTLLYMLLDSPNARAYDYSHLQYIIYAGAPMSVDRLKDAMDVFGPVMAQGFGQAEAPFFCTILSPEEHVEAIRSGDEKRLASCGRPTPFTRVAVMDNDGRLLPTGETGEIVVQGDLVMKGYYNNPEATAQVSQFGWHHTGDVGLRDENGFYYIVDRKRDLIISGGFNIAPSEIERVLWSHYAVGDCAVIGVPDEKWGEAVKAVVELRPGQDVSEDELRRFCRERLGGMKTPKTIEFWPQLPRSQIGKVLKRDVRAKFWEGQARKV
jgi:acyl-CoA synthetase (AMP-forming)/AMP-acid ligase II